MALAWVLANENVSSAVTGASRLDQIHESVKSLAGSQKLDPEIMVEIDAFSGDMPPVVRSRQAMS